jgi:hypothetical protein
MRETRRPTRIRKVRENRRRDNGFVPLGASCGTVDDGRRATSLVVDARLGAVEQTARC